MPLTEQEIAHRVSLLFSDPVQLLPDVERAALRRCALPRWFDQAMYERVLANPSDGEPADFAAIRAHDHVAALPGAGDRLTVREPYRSRLFEDWWGGSAAGAGAPEAAAADVRTTADGPIPSELADLSHQLAAWFAPGSHDDPYERLYHLILADRNAAAELFIQRIDDAVARFDLPGCDAILRTMEERQALLGQRLAGLLIEKRHAVTTRALWAREHYETIQYYERELTRTWLDDLVAGRCGDVLAPGGAGEASEMAPTHDGEGPGGLPNGDGPCWLLHIFAGGGLGKTMFIRATIARNCVPAGIPCARIDFDFVPHLAVVAREPWRLLLSIAEQLNPQWPARPFDELLAEHRDFVAQAGGRPIPLPRDVRAVDAEVDRRSLAGRVLDRFGRIVAESGASGGGGETVGPVLLIFDTLENLRSRNIDPEPLFQLMRELHDRVPRVRCILAGRYDLIDGVPVPGVPGHGGDDSPPATPFARLFAGSYRKVQLLGFTAQEAREYLEQKRHLAGDPRMDAIVAKACGTAADAADRHANPFTLALLADIVRADPLLSADQIAAYPTANLIYLIERVIERVDNRLLRWLLRYGVVPRQLTLDYVRRVMLPYLQAVRATGRVDEDDVASDALPPAVLARQPWSVVASAPPVDVDALWRELYAYTSDYAWVSAVGGASDTVAFHADVVEPMRQLIEPKAIHKRLVADTIAYYTALGDAAGPEERARWIQEVVYHRYRLDPAAADAAHLADLDAAGDESREARDLADAILANSTSSRASLEVRARASYVLAYDRLRDPRLLGDDERLRVKGWLDAIDAVSDHQPPVVHPARVAFLNGRWALDQGDATAAAELCATGLARPADAVNVVDLHALRADALSAGGELDAAIDARRQAWDLAATDERARRRCLGLGLALGGALASRDRWEEAEQAFEDAWSEAERRRAEADMGIAPACRALLGQLDANARMGREARAVALGEQRLGELRSWRAGTSAWSAADRAAEAHVEAEIRLVDGRPDRAMAVVAATAAQGAPESPAAPAATGGLDVGPGSVAWIDLQARIAEAALDIPTAVRHLEVLAGPLPRAAAANAGLALIRCADLHATHTGDWREARRYLDRAAAMIDPDADPASAVRWAMVHSRVEDRARWSASTEETTRVLKAAGISDGTIAEMIFDRDRVAYGAASQRVRNAGTAEATRARATAALRAEASVAAAALTGPTDDAITLLKPSLEAVESPSLRLRIVGGLSPHRPAGDDVRGQVAGSGRMLDLQSLVPPTNVDGATDSGLVAARRAAWWAWVGNRTPARTEAAAAIEAALASGRFMRLRAALRLMDGIGWDGRALAAVAMPEAAQSDRLAMPHLWGLMALEHAERLWAAFGSDVAGGVEARAGTAGAAAPDQGTVDRAALLARVTALLVDAAGLLGTAQPAWVARVKQLEASVARASGHRVAAGKSGAEGLGLYMHAGDTQATLDLFRWLQEADLTEFLTDGARSADLAMPETWPVPAAEPSPPPPSPSASPASAPPDGRTLSISLRTDPDGVVTGHYTTAGEASTRHWPDAAHLFRRDPFETAGAGFMSTVTRDWASVAHVLGGIVGIAPEGDGRAGGSEPDAARTGVALSVAPDLAWVPWELARPADDRPPMTLDAAFAVHRQSDSQALMPRPARGDRPRVVVIRPGSEVERGGMRGIEQTTGISLLRLYGAAGIEVFEVVNPGLDSIQHALRTTRPAVVHIAAGLTDRLRGRPALKLGQTGPRTKMYQSAAPDRDDALLTTTDLAMVLRDAPSLALVVLDADSPPTISERLHKLCLRNAFLAEVAAVSGVAAAIGIGLGEPDAQQAMVEALAHAVARGGTAQAIIDAVREPAPREPIDPFIGRVGWSSRGVLGAILPYAAAALWSPAPEAEIIRAT